ncbi:MAG: hypothetical protein CVV42_02885 [Candidatus Riflebacteria bacterium HGW-Riflebacteria-2]|nr:MAG: hypothetical protein CVV42_02885 [Candidatus Riflebacteria bacterium HGW-Riflebacteria-2]
MKRRRGELSLDGIIILAFITVIVATGLAMLQFHLSRQIEQRVDQDITLGYNLVLINLRQDTRLGNRFEITENGFAIIGDNNKPIAVYRLLEKSLYRFDESEKGQLIINNLEKASFKLHPELKNLLLVTLLPVDHMQLPFFTSFALRGRQS